MSTSTQSVREANARRWQERNFKRRNALRAIGTESFAWGLSVDYKREVILHKGVEFQIPFDRMVRGQWMSKLTDWLVLRPGGREWGTALELTKLLDRVYPFLPCGRAREQPIGDGLGPESDHIFAKD